MVDDNAVFLMDATAILKEAGLEVMTAMPTDETLRLPDDHDHRLTAPVAGIGAPGSENGSERARHAGRHWPASSIMVASSRRYPVPGEGPETVTSMGKPSSVEGSTAPHHKVLPEDRMPNPPGGKAEPPASSRCVSPSHESGTAPLRRTLALYLDS